MRSPADGFVRRDRRPQRSGRRRRPRSVWGWHLIDVYQRSESLSLIIPSIQTDSMAAAHTQAFEDAITVTPLTSHTYAAYLREEWCIGAGSSLVTTKTYNILTD